MPQFGLIVLCGLPGVGKSTLCEKLCASVKDITCVHVNFDDLMPVDIEKELIGQRDDEGEGSWKAYRGHIKTLLAAKLSELVTQKTEQGEIPTDLAAQVSICNDLAAQAAIPNDLAACFQQAWSVGTAAEHMGTAVEKDGTAVEQVGTAERIIVLIDDNMYYRSMRYEYYQLARAYHIGFGQIYFQCSVSKALEGNQQRPSHKIIPHDIIEKMASKIEPPTSEEWEKFSITVSDDFNCSGNFRQILEFFHNVMENPVEPIQEVDPKMQELSRVACSESLVYQTDQILRKLVSECMTSKKGCMDKGSLKSEGMKVNAVRTDIILDMKKKRILVSAGVAENSVDAALDRSSALFEFVQTLFQDRLK